MKVRIASLGSVSLSINAVEQTTRSGLNVITLYGIHNCDTIRKARKWLDAAEVEYTFHDYRKHAIDAAWLKSCAEELGWESLLNRRGTTWRQLSEEEKSTIDEASAIRLMVESPAMIKRPLIDTGTTRYLGFSEQKYRDILTHS